MLSGICSFSLRDFERIFPHYVSDIMLLENTEKSLVVRTTILFSTVYPNHTSLLFVALGQTPKLDHRLDWFMLEAGKGFRINTLPGMLRRSMSRNLITSYPNLQQCLDGPVSATLLSKKSSC